MPIQIPSFLQLFAQSTHIAMHKNTLQAITEIGILQVAALPWACRLLGRFLPKLGGAA
ncbi:protein of unknown function [Rhodovastum atsumiense]|nr:protein of unknown function [Rhodovastum atsumiense]